MIVLWGTIWRCFSLGALFPIWSPESTQQRWKPRRRWFGECCCSCRLAKLSCSVREGQRTCVSVLKYLEPRCKHFLQIHWTLSFCQGFPLKDLMNEHYQEVTWQLWWLCYAWIGTSNTFEKEYDVEALIKILQAASLFPPALTKHSTTIVSILVKTTIQPATSVRPRLAGWLLPRRSFSQLQQLESN